MNAKPWVCCLSLCLAGAWLAARAGDETPSAWDYRLGQGFRLGESGVTLGGYASAQVARPSSRSWSFEVKDLSLFVTAEKGRWRFFSETEIDDALSAVDGHSLSTNQASFDAERLYLDYTHDEALKLRVGKFLTPVGRWNLIHADPLVWTTSRPLVTEGPFAPHVTGVMLFGGVAALEMEWNYSLFASGRNQLDMKKRRESLDSLYRDTFGLRLVSELPGRFQAGMSYAHFEQTDLRPGSKDLVGLDFFWTRKRFEFSGEFAYRWGESGGNPNEWGLFLQGVAPLPLGENLYAVGRYETYQGKNSGALAHLWIAGLAYRPLPPLVFKAEYGTGINDDRGLAERITEGASDGFAASVAVLF